MSVETNAHNAPRTGSFWQFQLRDLLILVAISAVVFAFIAQAFTMAKEAAFKTICAPGMSPLVGGVTSNRSKAERKMAERQLVHRLAIELSIVGGTTIIVTIVVFTAGVLTARIIKHRRQTSRVFGGMTAPSRPLPTEHKR